MRVALRRQELLKSLIGDNAEEEMRLTRISGSDLRSDPALLLDGLKASGFFPGLRAVFVEGATDTNSAVIDAAMQDWQIGRCHTGFNCKSIKCAIKTYEK